MTMTLFFEYSNFIVIILLLIGSYQVFYKKKSNSTEDNTKSEKKSKLKQSKIYKYLYKIYVTRARKRKLASFLPWVGLWVSVFAMNWFLVLLYGKLINPVQKFENLTEWHGTLKAYYHHRKADDILVFTMENNTTKSFHGLLRAEFKNIGKKIVIWTQRDWGLTDGLFNGEFYFDRQMYLVLEEDYDENITKQEYQKNYKKNKEREKNTIPNLILSLKWVLGFLLLLWFINRKDVKEKVEK